MKLRESPKIFENYKCDYPENTIKRIEGGFKKIGLEISYYETTVSYPDEAIFSGYALIDLLGIIQNGKGITRLLAKASAYAELAERFSSGFILMKIPFPEKIKRYRELIRDITDKRFLKGYVRVKDQNIPSLENINRFLQKKINKKQYNIFKREGVFDVLVDAYSLVKNETVKVPIMFIERKSASTGLAAGNTLEEAIAQASFEIFERYCANKIVYEKIVCSTINPDTIENKKIHSYLKMFKSLNIDVLIKDFTLGNKLPTIGILFINNNIEKDDNELKKRLHYQRIKVASHCNLNEAILRCFTEYVQNTSTEELIKRENLDVLYNYWIKVLNKKYVGVDDEFKYFTRFSDYYGDLSFLKRGKVISFKRLKSVTTDDSLKDVEIVKNICIENNWDMLVVDYTHKIIGFPTVRVIIPPISTDYDNFIKKYDKIESFEEKFNKFYGIDNFLYYIKSNEWIHNKNKIQDLIKSLEDYLSRELPYYNIFLTRENNFQQFVNLLHILPFLYLSLDMKKEALDYFKFLLKLKMKPPYKSSFFRYLFLSKYNPDMYKRCIYLLQQSIDKNTDLNFELRSNPFKYEVVEDNLENIYCTMLKIINNSFI